MMNEGVVSQDVLYDMNDFDNSRNGEIRGTANEAEVHQLKEKP